MKPDQKPVANLPAPIAILPEHSRSGWTVRFVVPTPKGTPADRLEARGELVRRGQGCTTA